MGHTDGRAQESDGAPGRHALVQLYLDDLAGRAPDAGTVPRVAADLDEFFSAVVREPLDITVVNVLAYATSQLPSGEPDRIAFTSRLRNVFRFFAFLVGRSDVPLAANPVPALLADRRSRHRQAPRPVEPAEPRAEVLGTAGPRLLLEAARTARDRAILAAMVFGALRVGEVVALRLDDAPAGSGRVIVHDSRGLRRVIPMAPPFFTAVDHYLATERPAGLATDVLFVGLKGPSRGAPLSPGAVQDVVRRICAKLGLPNLNSGDLRVACLAALRAAGMDVDALRVFAGLPTTAHHAAVPDAELEEEYRRAASLFDLGWFDEEGPPGSEPEPPPPLEQT